MPEFTWIPLHREATAKLLTFRDKQSELIDLLQEMRDSGLNPILLNDQNPKGTIIRLQEIDPFSFLSSFNRGITNANRTANWKFLKEKWDLKSEIPEEFPGIPLANNQNSWWISYAYDRKKTAVPLLWDLAESGFNNKPPALNPDLYQSCLKIKTTGMAKLTMGLFWINPEQYIALDAKNRKHLQEKGIECASENYDDYLKLLNDYHQKIGESFAAFSHEAFLSVAEKSPYAHPFDKIFAPGKADIALNHLARSIGVIEGVLTEGNRPIAAILRKHAANHFAININLGSWCVTGINGESGGNKIWFIFPTSHDESIKQNKPGEHLKESIDGQHYAWIEFTPDEYEKRIDELWPIHEAALNAVCKRFSNQEKSPFRKNHREELMELIMDKDKRAEILDEGIPDRAPVVKEDSEAYATESQHWWLNANPKIWDFINMKVGERQEYTAKNEKGNKRQKYKYFEQARPGDLVLGYLTTPTKQLVSLCKITKGMAETNGKSIEFQKVEDFTQPLSWEDLQSMPELENCEPIQSNQGSLFRVSSKEYEFLRSVIDDREENTKGVEPYSRKEALADLFMSDKDFDSMIDLLQRKKNIILQGAPGVGKTFVARRLAYALMEEKNQDRAPMIQFHQSYAYEDFIQGYRPDGDGGFRLTNGTFYKLCQQAQRDPNRDYFLIIDEINRGNLSKIFGELMMLMEADKRGPDYALQLAYSESPNDTFHIPENIHLIGTMNTADRSLAMVDYALRRRFAFIDLAPEFSSTKFKKALKAGGANTHLIDMIATRMNGLNQSIFDDARNLGRGYRIGHSFFCPSNGTQADDDWYQQVIKYEIAPLLREYWLDDESRAQSEIDKLQAK